MCMIIVHFSLYSEKESVLDKGDFGLLSKLHMQTLLVEKNHKKISYLISNTVQYFLQVYRSKQRTRKSILILY